jgi:hypothetical protein
VGQSAAGGAKVVTLVSLNTNATAASTSAPFGNPTINIQYLTPALDVPLPAKSIVPYQDYPRYISQPSAQTLSVQVPGDVNNTTLSSQTITLPAIPDLLMIYVRDSTTPQASLSNTLGDSLLTIAGISLNFDNFAGLLSSHTQQQLYRMSQQNGLEMDYSTWRGFASSEIGSNVTVTTATVTTTTGATLTASTVSGPLRVGMRVANGAVSNFADTVTVTAIAYAAGSVTITMSASPSATTGTSVTFFDPNNYLSLVGGPLILKPGKDFALSAGQAPSLVGNFSLQFDLRVQNFGPTASASQQIFVVAINSGFFETIKGSSRIIKGVLTEQDVLSAPLGAGYADAHMERRLGSGKISDGADHMEMARKPGKVSSNMSRYT